MSAEREAAVERRMVARHALMQLQARSITGDAPSAGEWGLALEELRESTFAVAQADISGMLERHAPRSHQTTPGRVTLTIRGHA